MRLAERRIELVYGGSHAVWMGALADSVLSARRVIGVIPEALQAREIAHSGLTDLHVVSSMHERKARVFLLSTGSSLCRGIGTLEELFEVWILVAARAAR